MAEFNIYRVSVRQIPEGRCCSAPRSPRADPYVVLLVHILQKFDINSLVSLLGITKVSKILSQKQVIKMLLCNTFDKTDIHISVHYSTSIIGCDASV